MCGKPNLSLPALASDIADAFPEFRRPDLRSGHDIKQGKEFAILTNIIHQEWSGIGVKEHKKLKQLKSQNLRDHMSEAELIFTALAELSTRQIAESNQATGLNENKGAAKTGGNIAKKARKDLESKTGKKVVTPSNYSPPGKQQSVGFSHHMDDEEK